jgi:DNA polymerase III sliding clamp (beta) subunit (PCNA family)
VSTRLHVRQCCIQQRGILRHIASGAEADDFPAIRVEHDQRRVALDAELLAPLLRAVVIAVQVHRQEQMALGDEVRP